MTLAYMPDVGDWLIRLQAYPDQILGGYCPTDHPKRTPTLLYETSWITAPFKGLDGQFALANGDPTGFGYHGDFMGAWDEGFLQQAIKTCTNDSGKPEDCPLFLPLASDDAMKQCTFPPVPEIQGIETEFTQAGLPGNNPLTYGPQPAPKPNEAVPASQSTSASEAQAPSPTAVPSSALSSSIVAPPSPPPAPRHWHHPRHPKRHLPRQ